LALVTLRLLKKKDNGIDAAISLLFMVEGQCVDVPWFKPNTSVKHWYQAYSICEKGHLHLIWFGDENRLKNDFHTRQE